MSDPAPFRYGDHTVRPGQRVYARWGEAYEFGEPLSNGKWLVYPILVSQGWEGEPEEYAGDQPLIVDPASLFPRVPARLIKHDVEALQETYDDLRAKISAARAEWALEEKEIKAREERIKRHRDLERLDDFISGQFTHVVKRTSSGVSVSSANELQEKDRYTHRSSFRLLTLFGDAKGDLQWRVNRWKDDSGEWTDVWLFSSSDQASAFAKTLIDEELEKWRNGVVFSTNIINSSESLGFNLPDDWRAHALDQQRMAAENSFKVAQNQLVEAARRMQDARKKCWGDR